MIKPGEIKISIAQINPIMGDIEHNCMLILKAIAAAKKKKADLIVFPELALCGYPPEDLLLKEHFIRKCRLHISKIAEKTKGITALVGYPESNKDGLYNSIAVVHSGRIAANARKIHLPNYGVFDEKRYFNQGHKLTYVSIKGSKICLSICEDLWVYDKKMRSSIRDKKPDLIINTSASPFTSTKKMKRDRILAAVSKNAKAPLVYCNLIGGQDELVFDGSSTVYDFNGNAHCRLASFTEDFRTITFKRRERGGRRLSPLKSRSAGILKNAVKNRPEDAILKALELGLKDYVTKNGFNKVLIGLSGGIDSALVAAISARALGPEKVVGVTMPSKYSSEETFNDAILCAKLCGISIHQLPIHNIFNSSLMALDDLFHNTEPGLAEENLQARIRGALLMTISNKFNWLVLATGNKSELATGYCTIYGDMCGGFAPIKDISKTTVYKLSRLINRTSPLPMIPSSVIKRPPTAELRPGQKDSDSLPDYSILDSVLRSYIEDDIIPKGKSSGTTDRVVRSIIGMVNRSEHKRRQSAPGTKISDKSFGKDRRLPITNRYEL